MSSPNTNTWSYQPPEVPSIADAHFAAQVQRSLDDKTKPQGSLGQLETLALRLACITGCARPELVQPQLLVFAADHGIARAHPVSAFPTEVTWQVVENMLAGGAGVSVLARQHSIALHVVDCGIAHDLPVREQDPHDKLPKLGAPRLWRRKVAYGTRDSTVGAAMTAHECSVALRNGAALVSRLPGNAVLLGEMGVGNTSAAALLTARLCQWPIEEVTGAGSGLSPQGVQRKARILAQALEANAHVQEPLEVLAALGGLELATMVGAIVQAAAQRRVIVVDGFISTAAVLVAARIAPAVLERCVFSHQSGEGAGHARLLEHLGAQPLLRWGMRLGEGSGAALVWPLLMSACAVLGQMASFEGVGMSRSVVTSDP